MEFPLRAGLIYTLGKLINTYHIYTAHMSPALNGSSALERFEHSNAIKIRNGIMFNFYPGLPHIHVVNIERCTCVLAPFFVLRFAFSIIHGSGRAQNANQRTKTGEAWERGYMCVEHTTWFKVFPSSWQRGKGVLSNILHERYLEHHQALQKKTSIFVQHSYITTPQLYITITHSLSYSLYHTISTMPQSGFSPVC